MHRESNGITRTMAYIFGFGIGITWIAIAINVLISAATGFRYNRLDWGVGYGLVGILLFAAGASAIIGTWWHQNRVKRGH